MLSGSDLGLGGGLSCPEKDRCTNYSCAGGFLQISGQCKHKSYSLNSSCHSAMVGVLQFVHTLPTRMSSEDGTIIHRC
jgi:hypothetical protein